MSWSLDRCYMSCGLQQSSLPVDKHGDDVVALQIGDDEDGSIGTKSEVSGVLSSRVYVLDSYQ